MKSLKFFTFHSKGRNNKGKITVRHKGGGNKNLFRKIDFCYAKYNMVFSILSYEYDPNRNTKIALVNYIDGEKRYIIPWSESYVGSNALIGPNIEQKLGNRLPLRCLLLGSNIYNLEILPKNGAKICRSSGMFSKIIASNLFSVIVRLPSKKTKVILNECFASLGQVYDSKAHLKKKYKAGQNRWIGVRPSVRGVAMNPIDHPHGGGEGKSPIGRPFPCTPWGKPALGIKTSRIKYHKSIKFIK